jgi:hypothetical protein
MTRFSVPRSRRAGTLTTPGGTGCTVGVDAIYHDRYQRTGDGWKFTERVYEVRYLDTTPLAGSAPRAAGAPADPPRETP